MTVEARAGRENSAYPDLTGGSSPYALAQTIREKLTQYHQGNHSGNGSRERTTIYGLLREYDPKRFARVQRLLDNNQLTRGDGQELVDAITNQVLRNPVIDLGRDLLLRISRPLGSLKI